MQYPSKETVEYLRREYPVGCRVELLRMNDLRSPPIGTHGIVAGVDSLGTIHVSWSTGSSLGVVLGEDLCRKID